MKKIFNYSVLMLGGALLLSSCRPDAFKDLGTPAVVANNLAGTWKLTKVVQTDEDAKNKGFQYGNVNIQSMDLTNVFPYTDFKLTLNTDGSKPTTFTTTPGNAPKIIKLASGTWAFDDPTYPKVLTLVNAGDTSRITLGGYPTGAASTLKVVQERRDASSNKLLITYTYEFAKQ